MLCATTLSLASCHWSLDEGRQPGCGCLSLYDAGSDAPLACPCLSRRNQDKQRIKKRHIPVFIRKNPSATGSFHRPVTSDQKGAVKK